MALGRSHLLAWTHRPQRQQIVARRRICCETLPDSDTPDRLMIDRILQELTEAVRNKTALIVCGSGVSKATDPSAPDWRSLIRSGIEESAGWAFADAKWRDRRLRDLDEGS